MGGLTGGRVDFIVLQTGVGLSALITEAEQVERREELIVALGKVTKVCRGPKPTAVLVRIGLKPDLSGGEPYTTAEVLAALAEFALKDRGVAVLHYGERNTALAETLIARGARLEELCLYEWQMPEDTEPLKQLIAQMDQGAFAAVLFSSQIQAPHLFYVAAEIGRESELLEGPKNKTVGA